MIRRLAAHWVLRWAWRQDVRALVDDLEGACWVVLLKLGAAHPRLRWEIQNAVQDELCLWLYGVTRGQRPRAGIAYAGEPADRLAARVADGLPDPLTRLVQHEMLGRIAGALRPDQIETWERAAWPTSGREYRIPDTRRFAKIRALAGTAIGGRD